MKLYTPIMRTVQHCLQLITTAAALLLATGIHAQCVGIGTTTPAPSARLEVSSTNQGFLLPRLTAAQRDGIANPARDCRFFKQMAPWVFTISMASTGSTSPMA